MQGKLWRMDLPNGSPVALSEAREARGGSWGSQNIIVFAPSISGPIARVAASGGSLVNITKTPPASPTISDRWPIFLPDGKHFLFLHALQGDADVQNEIRLSSIDGGDEETLLRGRLYSFQYAAGWLLTDRDGSLQAWKFDPGRGS